MNQLTTSNKIDFMLINYSEFHDCTFDHITHGHGSELVVMARSITNIERERHL